MTASPIRRRMRVAVPIMLAMAFAVSPAYAASTPAGDAYGGQGNVLDETVSGPPSDSGTAPVEATGAAPVTASEPASGSSLPFTGFDVTLLLAGGLVLLGVGVAMRRMARPRVRVQ
jgi:hypothetical protein